MEQNRGGFMGFMNYWMSGRKIKPAQIENIELYRMILNSIQKHQKAIAGYLKAIKNGRKH
jgi:hypothetical protein